MLTLPLNTQRPPPSSTIGFGLDVVFVANLADDFLEQVFDGHQAGGAAVFVDDDGALGLLTLELLSSSGTRLVSGTTTAGRSSVVTGRVSSAVLRTTRSFTKTKPAMLSSDSL